VAPPATNRAHETASIAITLFHFDSARLTTSAKRELTRLRAVITASPRVAIRGFTAGIHPQSHRQQTWSTRLSENRAKTVEKFLFGAHVPSGTQLSVTGMGAARDDSGAVKDRRTSIAYQRTGASRL
jgi:outer membrane protein OmpA-like peptidoglycan-associated protein